MSESPDTLPALPPSLDAKIASWPTFSISLDERRAIYNGWMPHVRLGKTGKDPSSTLLSLGPSFDLKSSTLTASVPNIRQKSDSVPSKSAKTIEIFCCYARKDQQLLNELKAHLMPLQRQGLISLWADSDISAGTDWEKEIEKHLDTAHIILLLVSPAFMNSEYCYSKEMKRALERHERGEATVIPVILRPVYWQGAPFGKVQALPKDAKPITSHEWYTRDDALFNVAEGIRKIVEQTTVKIQSKLFITSSFLRRLPIYWLLDCSKSMSGDPITAVNEGITMIHRELMNDPQALETVYISIITFSDRADQYPLTPIDQFRTPILQVKGNAERVIGAALRILAESIEQDLILTTATQHGDYRPIVFLLTDGDPTDNYRDAFERLHALRGNRQPTIIALVIGDRVNITMLHELTKNVFRMQDITPATIKGFFQWLE